MELLDYEREHLEKLRTANAACTVLLKKDGAFPLKAPEKVALYGAGARHTVKGGTGSGEVNGRFFTTVEQGLKDAGFTITTGRWLDRYDQVLAKAKEDFHRSIRQKAKETHQQVIIVGMGAVMSEPDYSLPLDGEGDTAVYVLSRTSGEGSDRAALPGDILLTRTEIRDIQALEQQYTRFLLVLNVGGPVDLTPVMGVSNILLLGQLGTETGAVLADILLGKSYPSGKLATTWAAWEDYCHVGEECCQDDTRYREGIYVGYRYFDSVGKKPLFPFGFGLGYTDFAVRCAAPALSGSLVSVAVSVTNSGPAHGREVVQAYLRAPAGELDKPYQELAAFQKTGELAPGQTETVDLTFDLADMASYHTQKSCYVLEKGDYILRVGTSSANTAPAACLRLERDVVTRQVKNVCGTPDFADWYPANPLRQPEPNDIPVINVPPGAFSAVPIQYGREYPVDEIVAKLPDDDLYRIGVGAFDPKAGIASIIGTASLSIPGAAGETVDIPGIKPMVMADGPAGLRLSKSYYKDKKGIHVLGSTMPESIAAFLPGIARWFLNRKPKLKPGTVVRHQYATAIPIGTSVAQSWDTAYGELCGSIVGAEMDRFGIHLWLAPALNIHRTIRCGRNFEYYSEDPLLSGRFAAALTRGVQEHPGCGVTIKHYAANNQETNRYNSNSIVSERAMREIYLKGFGICVRESQPAAVMTSYNLLNSIHTSQHPGLLEDILRCEFGFQGIVMTDWVTGGSVLSKNSKYPVPHAGKVAAAGGDLFMPGSQKEIKEVKEALKNGTLTRKQLQVNATRIIRMSRKLEKFQSKGGGRCEL